MISWTSQEIYEMVGRQSIKKEGSTRHMVRIHFREIIKRNKTPGEIHEVWGYANLLSVTVL